MEERDKKTFLDNIYPPQPKNKEIHQLIETYKHMLSLQEHEHITKTHKTQYQTKENDKSGVCKHTCNTCLQTIYRTNGTWPEDKISGTYTIDQTQ